jgi:3-oxoacyl-[acyl-carrier protein] reductase
VKTALIVGGASGIGLASAEGLATIGWRVVLADLDADRLSREAARIASTGGQANSVVMDVTSAASVEAAFREVVNQYGLDALVNAAGIYQSGTILDVQDDDWDRVLQVNLTGAFLTSRAAVAAFIERRGGVIVHIASVAGRTSSSYAAPNYVASKAGLIGLTMVLAKQHAAQGIRVNCIAPGIVETPMIASAYTPEQRHLMLQATPLGRFASASEIAEVVCFLATDQSSYMTGQTLNVNGGSFMQ